MGLLSFMFISSMWTVCIWSESSCRPDVSRLSKWLLNIVFLRCTEVVSWEVSVRTSPSPFWDCSYGRELQMEFSCCRAGSVTVVHVPPARSLSLWEECEWRYSPTLLPGQWEEHSWVGSDRGMWPLWATCRRHGIHFSDGFLGVTGVPSWAETPQIWRRYVLLGTGRSQVSFKLPDFFIQKWGEFGPDLKSPSGTSSSEKS